MTHYKKLISRIEEDKFYKGDVLLIITSDALAGKNIPISILCNYHN